MKNILLISFISLPKMLKLLFLIILTLGVIRDHLYVMGEGLLPVRYWVKISNKLTKDGIQIHCREIAPKLGDLGVHIIPVNGSYNWTYKSPWFSAQVSALFSCYLHWLNYAHVEIKAFGDQAHFVDTHCGGPRCYWEAREDAIYLCNQRTKIDKLWVTWEKDKP